MLDFPLEFALVVFPGNKFTGEIVPALLDLTARNIVRIVDIIFIRKDADGSTRTMELNDLDEASYKLFVPLGKQIKSLYSEDDLTWAASRLPENSSAVLLLWQDIWMEGIRNAMVNSGGVLAERGLISEELVQGVIDEMAEEDKS